jgi:polysaccharide biosynthesis PFTS motif protein
MNIPFLSAFFKKKKLYRIRRIIRGYHILKSNGKLGLVRKIKRELGDAELKSVSGESFFFGEGATNAALTVRQYLLFRNTGIKLNKVLLYSIGTGNTKIVFPLPKEYRQVLVANGFAISNWRSSIVWGWNVFLLWCFGIVSIVKHCYKGLRSSNTLLFFQRKKYAFFIGLQEANLPRPDKTGKSFDTITWYTQWNGAILGLDVIGHDVKNISTIVELPGKLLLYSDGPIPPIRGALNLARLLAWSAAAILLSLFDIFRGKWWNAFLLSELTKATVIRLSTPDYLAADYLFDNSNTVYRPVWTYEAEKKGSRIISYFYATFEDVKLLSGYEPNSSYWQTMNWPLYLVWDEYQESMVKRNVGSNANTCIVGPVWLNSSPVELPNIPLISVAVFDIPPVKSSLHFGFSPIAELDYGNPEVMIQFIRNIDNALSLYKGIIIHKKKRRNAEKHLNKRYVKMLNEFEKNRRLISIDPDASPLAVIEKCAAVISIPFTSTAIMGRELGKPSIYYDPTGLISKDDRGAHGILIITTQDELKEWMENVFRT